MNTQPIPRIVEKANPGFEEFTAANFAEPPQETDEQKNQRTALLEQIKAEQNRLNIDNAMLEFLIHQQTGATRLDNVSIFNVMLFRDYLRGLESRQVSVVEPPPYLDFVDGILYMGGNNKGLIDSWVHFLTKSHAFAESGKWDVAIEQRFSKSVKYQAIIKGVGSVEALKWIEQNFDPKKHPPFHPIAEWKRPDPIVTPKGTERIWIVKVDMQEIFKGSETEAKQRAFESAQNPKTKIVSLVSPDLKHKVYK
ncbi:hypothetical protein [Microcoleus sp. Pol12B5]|uniref:hypothetical protein n=1 Tax=Microcoleus sp. Pol12B5 TaxID=3055396 RepID=UPI002FD6D02B